LGQKVNPIGMRLAVNKDWRSRWFSRKREFGTLLIEDMAIRKLVHKRLEQASVPQVLIERYANRVRVSVYTARPGVVIGRKGQDLETIRADIAKMTGKEVYIEIKEVRNPDVNAQLVSESVALQLTRRVAFKRAMKRAMQNAMRLGAQGIKIMSAGRLNGIEIARTEWYREGRVPLHTLRADIDYGTSEAKTTYGLIGVKVWVFKGEVGQEVTAPVSAEPEKKVRKSSGAKHATAS